MSSEGEAYQELARLLVEAAEVIDSLTDLRIYVPFDSSAEFSDKVRKLATRIASEEHAALREVLRIFAPTCAWDDAIGFEGMDLANRIMGLLDLLKWNAERDVGVDPRLESR